MAKSPGLEGRTTSFSPGWAPYYNMTLDLFLPFFGVRVPFCKMPQQGRMNLQGFTWERRVFNLGLLLQST